MNIWNNLLNTHKQIKVRSLYSRVFKSGNSYDQLPDYEYFNDKDITYSDFIQRITSVINKIAPSRR